jgi:SOS-response transcriptional repressor LexA
MDKKEEVLREWNGGISRGAQRKLAQKLKLNEASVSSWLSGRAEPSEGNILKMSRLFNMPAREIEQIFACERRHAGAALGEAAPNGARNIPVLPVSAAGKYFFTLGDAAEVYLPIKKSASEGAFAVKIIDDSMADAKNPKESIYEGDYAVITPAESAPPREGAAILARTSRGCIIRRYYKTPAAVELVPANKAYKTLTFGLYEVEILGQAVHIHRPLPPKPRN